MCVCVCQGGEDRGAQWRPAVARQAGGIYPEGMFHATEEDEGPPGGGDRGGPREKTGMYAHYLTLPRAWPILHMATFSPTNQHLHAYI